MSSIGAWNNFKKSWRHQAAMQFATLSVLIGSFTVVSISALVHQNMERMLTHWGQEVKVTVYLQDAIQDSEKNKIHKYLSSNKMFEKVHLLTKKEAAEKFKKRVGQYLPGLLSDLDFDNPIPASFEMVVNGGLSSSSKFDKLYDLVKEIKVLSGVDEVSYGQGWVENYASVLKVFSTASIVFIIVLMSGTLFVIGNSIRNSILQRREEVEVMELCGATRGMIIWPFIFEGMVTATMAAGISLLMTYFVFAWQANLIATDLSFWNLTAKFEYLSIARCALIIFIGAAIGGMGSLIWGRQISSGWAAAEANSHYEK
ncbi:MAG: permease-like cell division protein FtsX [Bdellovibrionales bacterium]|nr:permease-like cell division protein FtsX [Bdellovibrionales bacterium]